MKRLTSYPAIFYKEDDGGYSVIFPDLRHLATCGDDLEEAMYMATDCLAGYIHSLKLDNEPIPAPSDIKDITKDIIKNELDELYDAEKVFVNIIAVDVDEYAKKHFNKSVKKMVTIPQWMADMAESKKLKLSKILQEALKEKLQTT